MRAPTPFTPALPGFRPRSRGSRARRLLLEQIRFAIAGEPAAIAGQEDYAELSPASLNNLRARLSIMVGTIVVRLNREGFAQSDRIYAMRDALAAGRPVEQADIDWLDATIDCEKPSLRGSAGCSSR